MAVERKIDGATLPEMIQTLVEDAAEQGQPVMIERAGQVVGVVISPHDFALLTARKQALAALGASVSALRAKFADRSADEAMAEGELAAVETRAELRAERQARDA